MVVRLERRIPEQTFADPNVQAAIRKDRIQDLDEVWLGVGREQLFQQAYVWHPRVGEEEAGQAPADGAPAGETPAPVEPDAAAPGSDAPTAQE